MKTSTCFKFVAVGALLLGFAFPALAQHANVPILSTNFVKPNVVIMLDSSGSMDWNLSGGNATTTNPSRLSIAQFVLNGSGLVALQYLTQNVYMGQIGSSSNVRSNYVHASFTKVLLLKSCSSPCTNYKPDPNGAFFVFADADDVLLAAASGANAPANMSSCFTTLDQFLWKQKNYSLQIAASATDIMDGGTGAFHLSNNGVLKTRDVYQAVTSGGAYPRNLFVKHYSDVYNMPASCTITYTASPPTYTCAASTFETQPSSVGTTLPGTALPTTVYRTSRIFPVIYVPVTTTPAGGCYKNSSNKWQSCYKPDATGKYFVFMDNTDYQLAMNNTNQKIWAVSRPLSDFLASHSTTTYQWYANTASTVCGDGTGTCASTSNDGRDVNRVIYQWVADGTPSSIAFRKNDLANDPTETEVRTDLTSTIPQVLETDLINPDGIFGPDFIFRSPTASPPSNARLEYAARLGLSIPEPASNDILDYLNSALTYTKNGFTYHFLDGADPNNDGTFDGLTYSIQYYQQDPGLLDLYTNIRWGLAKYDNGGNNGSSTCNGGNSDFPGCGADLVISLPDEYTAATSAETARLAVKTAIANMTVGNYTPIADALRNMSQFFFAPALKANLLKLAGRNDTTPTMYVDQNCQASDGNEGHVVQDEMAYIKGCRKNFLIFVTDGVQTMGLGCNGTANPDDVCNHTTHCCTADVIPYDKQYVDALKNGGDPYTGVKVFVIGFALNKTTNEGIAAKAELEAIALESKMQLDPNDTYTLPYYANNEAELKAAFTQIFNAIMQGSYTRSAPKIDSSEKVEVDGYFTVLPSEPMWQGHLELYDLTKASTPDQLSGLTATADAGLVLNATLAVDRDIFTAQPASGTNNWAWWKSSKVQWNKVDFTTTNKATLLTDLSPGNQVGDTNSGNRVQDASALIAFIRNAPGSHFKPDTVPLGPARDWTLGAINRSHPLMIGPPGGIPGTNFPNYDQFIQKHLDRPMLIYVGANDGMLHAFYEQDPDGATKPRKILEEAFAYIPNGVLGTLKYLRENQWFYVDATPVGGDIFVHQPPWVSVNWSSNEPAAAGCDAIGGEHFCWRTLVVAGLGAGGRRVFALDVTDAATVAASVTTTAAPTIRTYWEFLDKIWPADPNDKPTERLGDTWSLPNLSELRLGDGDSTSVAAIFGGGWGASTEVNVGNYIYYVNLDDASIIRRFLVPDADDPNWKAKVTAGLSWDDPAVKSGPTTYYPGANSLPGDASVVDVPETEGLVELLYIGDLQGRVWKVNMADGHSVTKHWKLGLFYDTGDRTGIGDSSDLTNPTDGLPAVTDTTYAAFDALRRPVFYAPTVVPAPTGGRLVIFGTGHIEDTATARDQGVINCMFAVWDNDPVFGSTVDMLANYGKLWNDAQRTGGNCPQCAQAVAYPFCFQPGEKLISKPTVSEGLLSFQTFKPYSDDHCDTANYNPCKPGIVRDWFVDYLTFYGTLNLPGGSGRYIEQSEFSASGLTLTNKFGYIYSVPGGGLMGFTPPTGKSSDVLSWGEGISFP